MNKLVGAGAIVISIVLSLMCCTKKGDMIVEPYITTYKFTAYTIDSFRFKITLDDKLITDSLRSGSEVTSDFTFVNNTQARLKVYNTNNNGLLIDTLLSLKTGAYIISIVQLVSGQNPGIPSVPNEVDPMAGNCKVRFLYVPPQPRAGLAPGFLPFHDSLKCIIKKTVAGVVSYDTVVLSQFESTSFYESRIGSPFNFEIRKPTDNFLYNIVNSTSYSTTSLPPFNTVIVYASDTLSLGRFRYSFKRIY